MTIVDDPKMPFYYDPYSYSMDSSGVVTYDFLWIVKESNTYNGPHKGKTFCATNQWEDFAMKPDGSGFKSLGVSDIPKGKFVDLISQKLCGIKIDGKPNKYFYVVRSAPWDIYMSNSYTEPKSNPGYRFYKGLMFEPQLKTNIDVEFEISCPMKTFAANNTADGKPVWNREVVSDSKSNVGQIIWDRACNNRIPPNYTAGKIATGGASLSEAKKKCAELGMKAGTEGFGKCVLKFSE